MKVISVHLFQANLHAKMQEAAPQHAESTSQTEDTKAQSALLSALEPETPAKESMRKIDEFPKTKNSKEIPIATKSLAISQDEKMSSSGLRTGPSLPSASSNEESKKKAIVEARSTYNQRTRSPAFHIHRGGYGMTPYGQTNTSRPHNYGGEWIHPLNPQLQSYVRQGYRITGNHSTSVAPCLSPAPWLSVVPCLPPAPFPPVAPCLPQAAWLPMASSPPTAWMPVAPSPPATWLPVAPPPPAAWIPVASSLPSATWFPVSSSSPSAAWLPVAPPSSAPVAPCLPPPAPWCPTAPWLSPPPYLPAATWLPAANALPACLPPSADHFSPAFGMQAMASRPQTHFRENPTVPSYSSRIKTLPPPPYSSFFTNTPPPLYSSATLNPTAAPYSPPPAYSSSSSPSVNPEARTLNSLPPSAKGSSTSAPYPLNPAAPPYKSPSPISSLTAPPAEPWIPETELQTEAEPSFFAAAPFSEDPIFSSVWKPLAAELFASSKHKSGTACVKSDSDPLGEYRGGSVWSSES